MRASFKFFRRLGDATASAAATVEVAALGVEPISWDATIAPEHRANYGEASAEALEEVSGWHRERGGAGAAFRVVELAGVAADAQPDAVACAISAAAWKALGYPETEIEFRSGDGQWRMVRPVREEPPRRDDRHLQPAVLTLQSLDPTMLA